MRTYIFLVLLVFAKGFTQNKVLDIPLNYNSTFYDGKEALAISNNETGELVLFIEDNIKTKVVLLNVNMEIVSELQTESLLSSFKSFMGYQINKDGIYSIFFTNNSNKKYGVLHLNFSNKSWNMQTLDFKLENERYIESISYNNSCYLISATKNSNNVNFYVFENGNFQKRHTLSFAFLEKKSLGGYIEKASDILKKGITKMDNTIPNGIETTSEPNKLYVINDNFVFTFDNNVTKTEVLTISPNDFKMNLVDFSKPKIDTESDFTNHNSFIYDNKIFQIKSSSNHLKFEIKNFETKEVLKEIKLAKEDTITFKNTPIIQEGGGFGGTREMEKTSKFLRKVSQGDIGISVYKQKGLYKITLGSEIIINTGGGAMGMGGFGGMPMGGMPMGGGFVGLSFNPTFYAYNGYSSTKTTYIDCLFNEEFNHVKGEIPNNVFDNITAFENTFPEAIKLINKSNAASGNQRFQQNTISGKPKLKNIFNHNGKLYFSYLDSKDRNYHIVEFQKD